MSASLRGGGLGRGEVGHGAGVGLVEGRLELGVGERLGHQLGLPDGEPVGGAGERAGHRQRGRPRRAAARAPARATPFRAIRSASVNMASSSSTIGKPSACQNLRARQQRDLGAAADVAPAHRGRLARAAGPRGCHGLGGRPIVRAHQPVPTGPAPPTPPRAARGSVVRSGIASARRHRIMPCRRAGRAEGPRSGHRGRTWTTSPAATAYSPSAPAHHQPALVVDARRDPLAHVAAGRACSSTSRPDRAAGVAVCRVGAGARRARRHEVGVQRARGGQDRRRRAARGAPRRHPRSRSEVAVSTGSSSRSWSTLMPRPTTTPAGLRARRGCRRPCARRPRAAARRWAT